MSIPAERSKRLASAAAMEKPKFFAFCRIVPRTHMILRLPVSRVGPAPFGALSVAMTLSAQLRYPVTASLYAAWCAAAAVPNPARLSARHGQRVANWQER